MEEPLAPYTTFRIGGPAWVLFFPHTVEALAEAVQRARREDIPYRIIGGGAKVLFPDTGFPGLVIHTGWLRHIQEMENGIWVEPGFPISGLVKRGLWVLAGVPGSAGGAVVMNAGTRYGSISSYVISVQTLLPNGTVAMLPSQECRFSYRSSVFREKRLPVLGVGLRLPEEIRPVADLLAERQRTQPLDYPSAGCVFRNPEGISAGWLIDQAGLKGARVGDAKISEKHANFIVNLGQARATHVLSLIAEAQEAVYRSFGLSLSLELEVISS
ncbi:MAG: UDP-N-acetylmuramate dehydrogenase [Candidatus Bipolaricaulota bacterium]|nr:UDP-N-acetylmuramate dehydrogenase [Candidatus Bipolaricaulota bacterium]MDW8126495.1 UDP-N-acetylmuramate dehydrogenase [Candidatus Bipolaricaulota bacterium]